MTLLLSRNVYLAVGAVLLATSTAIAQESPRGAKVEAKESDSIYGDVHALCIGIDKYKSSGISQLRWAVADAKAVSRVFSEIYGYKVQELLGSKATKDGIESSLQEYAKSLGKDDALLIFFAGHGATVETDGFGRTGFLVPYDASLRLDDRRDVEEWREYAIDMHELGMTIKELKARHVMILADACYSGFLGKRSAFGDRVDLQSLMSRPSRMAITAGTEEQVAYENESLGHGLFTHVLLEQLKNDSPTSAAELFVGLRDGVSRMSEGNMLPQMREIVVENGEFVFLPKSLTGPDVSSAISDLNKRINRRVAKQTTQEQVFEAYEELDYRFAINAADKEREWQGRFKRFEDNAAIGDELAMAALHYCYSKGLGTEPNNAQAYLWARRCFDSEHVAGMHVLGRCFLNGISVEVNKPAAMKLLNSAAEKGFAISQYSVASLSMQDNIRSGEWIGSQADMQRMIRFLEGSAGQKLRSAQTLLGNILITEQEPSDPARGMSLIKEASSRGLAMAQGELAVRLRFGIPNFLEVDEAETQRLLISSAEAGYGPAQLEVGLYHTKGYENKLSDFKPSSAEAFRLFELCHKQGDGRGSLMLFELYATGNGVPQDDAKAAEYLDIAVERGNIRALHLKGTWVGVGRVYDKDANKALTLFDRAARAGHIESWFFAGEMYEALAREALPGSKKTENQLEALIRYIEAVESKAPNAEEAEESIQWYDENGGMNGIPDEELGREWHAKWKKREFPK